MKRRLSVFYSLLLSAVFLLSLLSAGTLPVKAAPTKIDTGYLGLTIPSAGGSYSGTVNASLTPGLDSPFTVTEAHWHNGINQESGTIGTSPSTFVAGGFYYVEFELKPKEGYTFTTSTTITIFEVDVITLNYDYSSGTLRGATDNIEIASGPKSGISDVSVSLLIPGIGGTWGGIVPIDLTIPEGSGFSLGDSYWFNAKDQSTGSEGSSPSTFDAGCSYYAVFYLVPDSGYEFTASPSIDLSTIDVDSWEVLPNGKLYILTEPVTLTRDISLVSMTLTIPTPGGSFSGPVEAKIEPDKDYHFTVKDAYWYNAETQASGGKDISPTTFSPGGKYYAQFTVVPDEGYSFIYGTAVSIDDIDFESAILQADGTIIITTVPVTLPGEAESSLTTDSGSSDSSKTNSESSTGESSTQNSSGASGENSQSGGNSSEASSGAENSENSRPNNGPTEPGNQMSSLVIILLVTLIVLLVGVIVAIVIMISKNNRRR